MLKNNKAGGMSMSEKLEFYLEEKAEKAESLRIFSGVKLLHIKRQVGILLSHIGDNGIFAEYTKHNISHVNEMLRIAEWIIPKVTKEAMTVSEYMMLVLSIYFHDMGMLVTNEEYEHRMDNVEYRQYRKSIYDGEFGQEYIRQINKISEPEKFLYQEYVRKEHAKRIKQWILGEIDSDKCYPENIINEIKKLLEPVDNLFKHDLAMICESHHLNNLDDYNIYDTGKCYESTEQGKVNLQYVAVILRTVDLLHITMDRTPAIEYRVFCPRDPKSVIEWQKQMAIRAIKPMEMRDDDGNIDRSIQSDSIAITAYFEKADQAEAFFALNDYLRYVKKELKTCHDLIAMSIKKQGTKEYLFPWKGIDDSNIKTKNFKNQLLKFELEQNSILQMLVGHTLYNDSSVVIRELVQNGLDAIKLQNEIEKKTKKEKTEGEILVEWDEENNTLSFTDNGTGMTMDDIENYLLKVGTSKYSSAVFQKEYPDFVSISRFGIGILTCFLVADDIEIITHASENDEANRIFFRNVEGKYLLKTIPKAELPERIKHHGTIIKLHLRENNTIEDLEYSLRKWIVFPNCKVYLKRGNSTDLIPIGYESPKQALEEYIKKYISITDEIQVVEENIDGVICAYARRYRKYFQEYSLVEYMGQKNFLNEEKVPLPIGICFEGIRISNNTPGYENCTFMAILNTTNNKIVRTNVARSSVEDNEGKNILLNTIYRIYRKNIENQIETFKEKGRSLSWISSEVKFLVEQLFNGSSHGRRGGELEKREIFENVFGELNSILFEADGQRKLVSPNYIQSQDYITMAESNMINAAERLLKEIRSNISLGSLVNTITNADFFHSSNLLCDCEPSNILYKIALKDKTAIKIDVDKDEGKIDIELSKKETDWIKIELVNRRENRFLYEDYEDYSIVFLPQNENRLIEGLDEEAGVNTKLGIFLKPDGEIAKYICDKMKKFDTVNSVAESAAFVVFVSLLINRQISGFKREKGFENFKKNCSNAIERIMAEIVSEELKDIVWNKIDKDDLINTLYDNKLLIYDLNDWSRWQKD